jgi:hypothetical protein
MPFQSRTSLITKEVAFLTEVEGRKYGTFQLQLAYVVTLSAGRPSSNCLVVWKLKDHLTVTTNFLKQSPLDTPTGSQLVKKFSAFCGTRRFITAFTRDRHLSLS